MNFGQGTIGVHQKKANRKVQTCGKGKCELIAYFSATFVTSILSLSLSLS